MGNSHQYIYFYIMIILLYIFIYTIKSIKLKRETTRSFLAIVFTVMLMLSLKWIIYNTDGKQTLTSLTFSLKNLSHILNILPLLLALYYFDLHIINNKKLLNIRKWSYAITFCILAIYGLSNIWTELIFIVDDSGFIINQKGIFLHIYFQIGILLFYGVFSYKYFRRCVSKVFSLYVALVIMPVLGGSFQSIFQDVPALLSMFGLLTLYIFIFLVREDTRRDALTDVYSRGQFEEYLMKKLSLKRPFSIALMDIDEFKIINDTYGHSEGDELLIHFTKIIMRNIRSADMIARVGGDEFIIIIESNQLKNGMIALNRIKQEITLFNSSGEKPYQINFSTGLYYIDQPQDYAPQEVIKIVDQLMYKEKLDHHLKYNSEKQKM